MAKFRIYFKDGTATTVSAKSNRMAQAKACAQTNHVLTNIQEWRIIGGKRKHNKPQTRSTRKYSPRQDTYTSYYRY